jgi:hypothetical protein
VRTSPRPLDLQVCLPSRQRNVRDTARSLIDVARPDATPRILVASTARPPRIGGLLLRPVSRRSAASAGTAPSASCDSDDRRARADRESVCGDVVPMHRMGRVGPSGASVVEAPGKSAGSPAIARGGEARARALRAKRVACAACRDARHGSKAGQVSRVSAGASAARGAILSRALARRPRAASVGRPRCGLSRGSGRGGFACWWCGAGTAIIGDAHAGRAGKA